MLKIDVVNIYQKLIFSLVCLLHVFLHSQYFSIYGIFTTLVDMSSAEGEEREDRGRGMGGQAKSKYTYVLESPPAWYMLKSRLIYLKLILEVTWTLYMVLLVKIIFIWTGKNKKLDF